MAKKGAERLLERQEKKPKLNPVTYLFMGLVMNPDWITAIGTLLGGLGAIGLLAVTSQGLDAWRQQMVGKEEYEVAKRIIKTLFDAKDFARDFQFQWKFHGDKVDQMEIFDKYLKLDERVKEAMAEAFILWGSQWSYENFSKFGKLTWQMGQGSMAECQIEVESVRDDMVLQLHVEIDRLCELLRRIALGTSAV